MIPLFQVRMDDKAKEFVGNVLDSGYIGQGEMADLFESGLQGHMQAHQKPLTVNSCTSAIDLALHLAGVGLGDEVISTPMSCYASQVHVQHRQARLKWADVNPLTGCIDPDSVEKLINRNTKAIIAVDWAGRACDYYKLRMISMAYEIPIIEDAAHCWDVKTKEGYPITTDGGDYVCYSFQAIKHLTTGDGGALLVYSEEEYERALRLRWYGMDRRGGKSFRCTQPVLEPGFKYHMNDIAAAIGIANLKDVDLAVMSHRVNAAMYDVAFKGLDSITIPPPDTGCSYWLYSLLVEKGTKEQFMEHLAARGIASSPVHHRNDLYEATAQFREGPLPGLDSFSAKQVSIPVGWYLTEQDKERIIDAVRSY